MELNDCIVYINKLSEEIEKYFMNRSYGEDLKQIDFGIVSYNPEYNMKIKPRKKYFKGKKTISYDGISIETEDALEYEILTDFNTLINLEKDAIHPFISKVIFNSFVEISSIKNLERFDLDLFSNDFFSQFCKN